MNLEDPSGYIAWAPMLVGGAIGAGFSIGSQLYQGKRLREINFRAVGGAFVGGAIAATPGGILKTIIAGAVGNIANQAIQGKVKSVKNALTYGISGAVFNGVGFGVAKYTQHLAMKAFSSLSRQAKFKVLQGLYGKGSRAVLNEKMREDINFAVRLAGGKIRAVIYSALTSESTGLLMGN